MYVTWLTFTESADKVIEATVYITLLTTVYHYYYWHYYYDEVWQQYGVWYDMVWQFIHLGFGTFFPVWFP